MNHLSVGILATSARCEHAGEFSDLHGRECHIMQNKGPEAAEDCLNSIGCPEAPFSPVNGLAIPLLHFGARDISFA